MDKKKAFYIIAAVWVGGKILDLVWDLLSTPLLVYVETVAQERGWDDQIASILAQFDIPKIAVVVTDIIYGPTGLAFLLGAGLFAFWDPIVMLLFRRNILRLDYDPTVSQVIGDDGGRVPVRLKVSNKGKKTVSSVGVTIDNIERVGGVLSDVQALKENGRFNAIGDMKRALGSFSGLPLSVSVNRELGMQPRWDAPEKTANINPGRSVFFDLISACTEDTGSGNHLIQHANYRTSRYANKPHIDAPSIEQEPSGHIPSGEYEFEITVEGDGATPLTRKFRLSKGGKFHSV